MATFQYAQSSWSNQTAWIQGWCDGLLYALRRDYSEIMAEHSDDADTFEYDGVGYMFEPEYNDEELEALRRRVTVVCMNSEAERTGT